ncbi:MAG: NAD(P)-dependent oxidoreductase [Chromatiales bacterium]|jgi:putative NADH-flavin reductase|nr:NAD(P)-dependent oxidoreductase [Chromatiales bacterium]
MKIALVGATGFVGAAVLKEAAARGHVVTAIARNPAKVPASAVVTAKSMDVMDGDALKAAFTGQDVVISAYNPGWGDPQIYDKHRRGSAAIAKAAQAAGVRLIEVGGAGSLYGADGKQFVDTPGFPAEFRDGARGARDALDDRKRETGLDWTFVSPPFELIPGERTGKYRKGGEHPVADGAGRSTISVADLAVALLDEAERPAHRKQRFTVGY